jgi:epoxyqueuosine reductase QueG
MCPSNSINREDYPTGLTDKKTCSTYSAELNKHYVSPCGICIKVCPIGDDRTLYQRNNDEIYVDQDRFASYHRSWKHVRAYGGNALP